MREYIDAIHVLTNVLRHQQHLDDIEATPFVREISYGVARHYYSLRHSLSRLLSKPLAAKHLDLELLLLAGLYSVDHLNRPAHASVNAAVEATKGLKKVWAKGLINGVLRSYLREGQTAANDNKEALYNHPAWLIDAIESAWPERLDIFANNNVKAPMTLRVNTRKTSRSQYLELLAEHGIPASSGEMTETAVLLDSAIPVSELPGFIDGLVSVQDEAPQLAARFLNLSPGLRVLDACSAPGGKTCHILEAEPHVELIAIDRDVHRVLSINENLKRLELDCEVLTTSLEDYSPTERFDRVLLDVPCSATGIIRRHPDIKLLRRKADIDKLSLTQRVLIDKAFDLLRTGGELLYSTCSILPEENDQVVSSFLSSTPNALIAPIAVGKGQVVTTETGVQFFPTRDQHDGFFFSRVKKVDGVR